MPDKKIHCPVCAAEVECYSIAAKLALEHAISNLGNKEATGHNDGWFPETRQRWASIPVSKLKTLTVAAFYKFVTGAQKIASYYVNAKWCAMSASMSAWMGCQRAGVPCNLVERASTSRMAAEFKLKGKLSGTCLNGGIALLKNSKGAYEHTFLAVHQVGTVIHGVDGNISNKQTTTKYHIASRCFFGPVEG